jgi:hypothetical protein
MKFLFLGVQKKICCPVSEKKLAGKNKKWPVASF